MKFYKIQVLALGLLLAGLARGGQSYAQQVYYSGSAQWATGSYLFSEDTQSFYLISGLNIRDSRYSASFDIPFIVQNTPWISYSKYGGIPTGGPQNESVKHHQQGVSMGRKKNINLADTASYTQSGFSDPSLSVGYKLLGSEYGATSLYVSTSFKFPFTDPANGFGTGAWDLGLGSTLSRRFGSWFITVNVMYWHFGDMEDLELKPSLSYGAGVGKSFMEGKWLLMGSFSGMTQIIEDTDPPISAGLGIGYQVGPRINLNINTFVGLSESSSEFAFSGGWQLKLN